MVGKVCALEKEFYWYERKPLAGKKILVTRPRELSSQMADKLRRRGAEVLELPAIRTVPICPNPALEDCLERGQTYDWIVFTSPTGVRVFFERLMERYDVRKIAGARFAVIGSGTAKALKEKGFEADLMPDVYDGANLGRTLAKQCRPGERILIPRAALGTRELIRELETVPDLTLEDIPIYETEYETSPLIDEKKEFENGEIDYAVFTSASTVRGFARAVEGLDFSKVKAVCIGAQTRAAAEELGMKAWMSQKATMDSVAERLEELVRMEK